MGIEQDIESVRAGIKAGRFSNEASVSQGIGQIIAMACDVAQMSYGRNRILPVFKAPLLNVNRA